MVAKPAASWKQKRGLPPPRATGIRKGRFWSTTALVAVLAFVGFVIYWQLTRYTPKTYLLIVGKTPQEQLPLPPVRYVKETWNRLTEVCKSATHITLDDFAGSSGYRFGAQKDNNESFYQKISSAIPKLKRDDALVVWINGTGITVEGKPAIVGDLFNLANYQDRTNLVDPAEVLNAMSAWLGPKLLLIDWGQELFDPKIEMYDNQFASQLAQLIKDHDTKRGLPVCVLVSHFDGQVSLVDSSLARKESLFSRAVMEGLLLQDRRLPKELEKVEFGVPKGKASLSTRNFVEYVIRRVKDDSFGYQQPAVYISGEGLLEKLEGNVLQSHGLVSLDRRYPRPRGFPKPLPPTEADSKDTASKEEDEPKLTAEPQPGKPTQLKELWSGINELRKPDSNNFGWSYGALSPLAYKKIVADALDTELRYYADPDQKVDELRLPQSRFADNPDLDDNFEPSAKGEYRATYRRIQANRQWACVEYDLQRFAGTLESLGRPERTKLEPLLQKEAWTIWTNGQQQLDRFISDLIQTAQTECENPKNRGKTSAFVEQLLRCNLLSADQRVLLRNLQETKVVLNNPKGEMDKSRTIARPESTARRVNWVMNRSELNPELLEQAASGKRGSMDIEKYIVQIGRLDPRDARDALFSSRETLAKTVELINQQLEYPVIPKPATQKVWNIVWNSQAIKGDELKLDGPQQLKLVMTATSKDAAFPEVYLKPSEHLQLYVGESPTPWDVTRPLNPGAFASGRNGLEKSLELRVAAKNSEAVNGGQATLIIEARVAAGGVKIGKLPEPLAVYIPLDEPIRLAFYQSYWKDGQVGWHPQRLPLRPFAGRESKFQVRVENLSPEEHRVDLKFFMLDENPNGQTGTVDRTENLKQLEVRQPNFVWSGMVSGERRGQDNNEVVAVLVPPAAAAPAVNGAATPAQSAPPPAGKLSLMGGMVVFVAVDGKPLAEPLKVNFNPRRAIDLIDAEVKLNRNRSLVVSAAWKDGDVQDGMAAIAPDDLDKKPMTIAWDSLPWKQNNLSVTTGEINLKDPGVEWQSFETSPLQGNNKEVWLNIDDVPRALVYSVIGDTDKPIKIPLRNARAAWRSIGTKVDDKPLFYVPYNPPPAKKDERALIGNAAVFKDLNGVVEVALAVDLPSAAGNEDGRFQVRLGGQKVVKNLRPRRTQVEANVLGDQLAITWTERDQAVAFDFTNDSLVDDQRFQLKIEGPDFPEDMLNLSVVADVLPPDITSPRLIPEKVVEGTNAEVVVSLKTKDQSGTVIVNSVRTVPATLPLIQMPKTARAGEEIRIPISTGKLLAGKYQIYVDAVDGFGHDTQQFIGNLRVDPPPKPVTPGEAPPPPEVKGTLKVVAGLPLDRTAINTVTFKFDPPIENANPIGNQRVEATNVKGGRYKVTATYSERNIQYTGEKEIILSKLEDYQKEFKVTIAPKGK